MTDAVKPLMSFMAGLRVLRFAATFAINGTGEGNSLYTMLIRPWSKNHRTPSGNSYFMEADINQTI